MKAYEVEHQVRVTLDGQAVTITIRGRGKSWFGGEKEEAAKALYAADEPQTHTQDEFMRLLKEL